VSLKGSTLIKHNPDNPH